MQSHSTRQFLSVLSGLLAGAFCLASTPAWAHLPHPIETSGAALAVDHDTQTLVFKEGKGKKPVVLDWNKDTQFIKDGQPVAPAALTNGVSVVIFYKNVSFRNPLLKKVQWSSNIDR